MIRALLILALALSGCASTSIVVPGKLAFRTSANARNIHFTGAGVTFSAEILDHASVIDAQGNAITKVATAAGAGISAVISTRLLRP